MTHSPILAGVIGNPVKYSLSPLIHEIWCHRDEINGYYLPIEPGLKNDDFVRVLKSLRTLNFAGVNVTSPFKEAALANADEASDLAKKAGAANRLTFRNDGNLYADNSDVYGFHQAFVQNAPNAFLEKALVLGAGGASRGVVLALQAIGFKEIFIANRTFEKAQELACEFALTVLPWDNRHDAVPAVNAVVNTTKLGMTGSLPLELDLTHLSADAVVADIVYSPLETSLLKQAKACGAVCVDGLDMLMHQAVPGFREWFGGMPKVDKALRDELLAALARRNRESTNL